MRQQEQRQTGSVPPSDVLAAAVKLALQRDGETATVAKLQISRTSLSKLAAGLPVRRGTAALAAMKMGLISEIGADMAGEIVGG
jgi:hypothetical protein